MAITVADLIAKLSLDTSAFDSAIGRVDANTGVLGRGMAQVGTAVLGMGAATVGAGGLLVKFGSDLQDALMPVGTLVGEDTKLFAEMSESMKDMMANSPRSADDIGMAAYETLGSGVAHTADELENVMLWTTRLADAGLGSLSESTDLVTSAMNAFAQENLSAKDAAELLFGAISIGKGTTATMAEGFGSIAPLAASAGISFHDLMAATATLTTTGMSASTAYASLKGVMTNVLQPSEKARDMAESLGISFDGASLAAMGLPAFLDQIAVAAGGDATVMSALFGDVKALSGAMALTGPLADAFATTLDNIGTSGMTLADRAKEVQDNWSYQFGVMKNKAILFASEIGLQLIDWLQPRLANFRDWIVNNWPAISDVIQQVWDKVRSAFDAILPVLTDVLDGGKRMISDLADAFDTSEGTILKVIGGIAAALVGLAIAWNLGPGIIVLAIVGLVAGFLWAYNNVEWFHDGVVAFFSGIRVAVNFLIDWWNDNWPTISATVITVWDAIVTYTQTAIAIYTAIIQTIITIVQTVIDGIMFLWDNFGAEAIDVITSAFNLIVQVVQTAVDVIYNIVSFFINIFQGDWRAAWQDVLDIFSSVWDLIIAAIDYGIQIITLAWDVFVIGIKAAWDGLWMGIKAIFDLQWAIITGAIDLGLKAITDLMNAAWAGIQFVAGLAWSAIQTAITTPLSAAAWIVGIILNGIQAAINGVWAGIQWITGIVWEAIKQAVIQPIGVAAYIVGVIIDGIKNTVMAVWDTIRYITVVIWESIKSAVANGINAIQWMIGVILNGIESTWNRVWNGLKDVVNSVMDAIQWVIDKANDAINVVGRIPIIGGGFNVPFFAAGGIVNSPTLAMVGEAGKELILPLTDMNRTSQLLKQAGLDKYIAGNGSGSSVANSYMGNSYNINVYVAPGGDLTSAGEQTVEAIIAYERRNGTAWRN